MADSVLNLILRASKTGTGAADAKRELQALAKEQEAANRAGMQATRAYLGMAQSLAQNASAANVTQQALGRLNTHMAAGRITTEQYAAAAQAAMLKTGQISPASLQAADSINKLNANYAQGKLSGEQYAQGLSNIQGRLAASTPFMERYGAALKSIALVGLGALAVGFVDAARTAGEFEKSMNLIVALTNTTKQEIGGMTTAVLEMSRATGKGPNELAQGLYFVASSGFAGAQGLKVLEASAKASAAGLGETKVVADAVTSTLNAYKMGVEQSTHVTDILINVVKEGKGEPAAFAGALGRILPIAAAAGVSFEQVGASMATMTRIGLSAEEAATSLRGVLSSLEKPGKQAQDALAGIGLSADDVRKSIRDRGLLITLQDMMERTQGNVETLGLIIPNIRALTGVLATAGSQGEEYARILGTMGNASGATETAFKTASETMEFSAKQTEASFDALKISLMQGVLPALKSVFDALNNLIGAFNALPDGGKQAIENLALIAIGTAPALIGINKLIGGVKGLAQEFKTFKEMTYTGDSVFKSLSALRTLEFGALAGGLLIIVTYLEKVGEAASASSDKLQEMAHSGDLFKQAAASTEILTHGQDRLKAALDGVNTSLIAGGREYADYRASIEATAKAAGYQIDAQGNLIKVTYGTAGAQTQLVQSNYELTDSAYKLAQAQAHVTEGAYGLKGPLDESNRALESQKRAADLAKAGLDGVGQSASEVASKQRDLALATASMTAGYAGAVSKEMKDYGAKQDELKTKAADLAKEISELERVQGRQVATSVKGTLTTNEVAAAQAKLAAVTEDLTLKQRKKNETDAEFNSRMAALQVNADKLTAKLGSGGMGSAIVDNSKKIGELKTKYDETTKAINENALAHDEAMKRIVLDIAMQQLATDGWTQTEINAFTQVAVKMGIFDQASADLTNNVLGATAALAQDGNIDVFGNRLSGALDNAAASAAMSAGIFASTIGVSMSALSEQAALHGGAAEASLNGIGTAAQNAANTINTTLPPALSQPFPVPGTEAWRATMLGVQTDAQTTAGVISTALGSGAAALPAVDTKAYNESLGGAQTRALETGAAISTSLPTSIAFVAHDPSIPLFSKLFNVNTLQVQADALTTSLRLKATLPPMIAAVATDPNIPLFSRVFNTSMTAVQADSQTTANQINTTIPPALAGLANDPNPGKFASSYSASMSEIGTSAAGARDENVKLKKSVDDLKSKTITITTIYKTIGSPEGGGESGGGSGGNRGGSGRQFGGPIPAMRPTLVGEAGPELFFPAHKGFVMDNSDSTRLIAALEKIAAGTGRAGNAFNLTVNTPGQASVLRDFAMLQALAGG